LESFRLQLNKAKISCWFKNWDQAIEIYSQIIKKYPQYLPAYCYMDMNLINKKYEKPLQLITKALKLIKIVIQQYYNLGIAYNNAEKDMSNACSSI
jgi:tetratricopeptide (TPR) repeat protein